MKTESTFIIHPETTEQVDALKAFVTALKIKFEVATDTTYDPAFVEKIQEARKEVKEGKSRKISLDEIWKE